ncbi:MAG: SRPBCC domain-containing protein [Planctomycetes bacterium]|nr:SRPBCC domain-containing protein [Planctomycetota bacterium]
MRILSSLILLLLVVSAVVAQEAPPTPPPADPAPAPAVPKLTRMKLGEFWYGMYPTSGGTEGYVHVVLRDTAQQGVNCDFDLHISDDGWEYEETRQITFDAAWRLTYSEWSSGMDRILAAREGDAMVGKSGIDDLRVEVAKDAMTGMGYILAAAMAQKEGATLKRHQYSEDGGLNEEGETTFVCKGNEEVELPEGKVKAWKYVMQTADGGPALALWVNDAREIVLVDWQRSLMKLHRGNTEELFKPAKKFLSHLEPRDKTKLVLSGDFTNVGSVDEMWKLWATGEGLTKWWPKEAEVEGKVGGKYQPTWKDQDGNIVWQLLGVIETWEPNKKLGFSWKWNTDPEDAPALHVLVEFEQQEHGVRVKITHSSFDPVNDDQKNRESLKGGWEAFCSKLSKLDLSAKAPDKDK